MRVLTVLPLLLALAAPALADKGSAARWGARDPVTCSDLVQAEAPSTDQVAALLQCAREEITASDELWLMENVRVQIAGPRPYIELYETLVMENADTTKPVYPIRGSWTWATCRLPEAVARTGGDPALNCGEADVSNAQGGCWLTTFGDWRCAMNGTTAPTRPNTAPPK